MKSSTPDLPWDLLFQALEDNALELDRYDAAPPNLDNPSEPGDRRVDFESSEMDRSVPSAKELAEKITQVLGLPCKGLINHWQETSSEWNFCLLVASSDTQNPWALKVEGGLPHDKDFYTRADICLVEGRQLTDELIASTQEDVNDTTVKRITELVRQCAGESEEAMIALWDTMVQSNPKFMQVWRAHMQGQSLDHATPPAHSIKSLRM